MSLHDTTLHRLLVAAAVHQSLGAEVKNTSIHNLNLILMSLMGMLRGGILVRTCAPKLPLTVWIALQGLYALYATNLLGVLATPRPEPAREEGLAPRSASSRAQTTPVGRPSIQARHRRSGMSPQKHQVFKEKVGRYSSLYFLSVLHLKRMYNGPYKDVFLLNHRTIYR